MASDLKSFFKSKIRCLEGKMDLIVSRQNIVDHSPPVKIVEEDCIDSNNENDATCLDDLTGEVNHRELYTKLPKKMSEENALLEEDEIAPK